MLYDARRRVYIARPSPYLIYYKINRLLAMSLSQLEKNIIELLRRVMRSFYETEHIVIVELLLQHLGTG